MVAKRTREKARRVLVAQTFVSVDSIAGYCMVSRSTVNRWIRDGKLTATTLPSGHHRVSVADFRDFLKRQNMPIRQDLSELPN